jgi:hypothetical protein
MSAFTPADWSNFFVAEAGAAAALTGLMIVAISINLATLLKTQLLTGRAAETVALLTGILILASFALVPGQPLWVFGAECAAVGLVMCLVAALILYRARKLYHPSEARWLRFLFNFGGPLPVVAAGISLMAGTGGGLYWLVPGVVISLLGGIVNTWILLVEILR